MEIKEKVVGNNILGTNTMNTEDRLLDRSSREASGIRVRQISSKFITK